MNTLLRKLKAKVKRLESTAHAESFEAYGHCTLPACSCKQRPVFSYVRMDKLVQESSYPTPAQIKWARKKARLLFPDKK